MAVGYILTIILSVLISVGGLFFVIKYLSKRPSDNINLVFSILICAFHLLNIIFSIAPANGYNLWFCTPISNISPFLFFLVFISIFVPKKIKERFYKLFCLFNFVMFFAAIGPSIICLTFSDPVYYYPFLTFDALTHVTFALFSIYLLLSKQISINKKDLLIDALIVASVIVIAIVVNLIFDTLFFGLNFYGKHQIYGVQLIENKWLSACIYILSLSLVMLVGYYIHKVLIKGSNREKN